MFWGDSHDNSAGTRVAWGTATRRVTRMSKEVSIELSELQQIDELQRPAKETKKWKGVV